MGFKMPSALAVVAIVCAGLGLMLHVVGVSTLAMSEGYFRGLVSLIGKIQVSIGLYRQCSGDICDTPEGGLITACRAFGSMGLLALLASASFGGLTCMSENSKLPVLASILGFFGGACCLIELGLFAWYVIDLDGFEYGYSFFLTAGAGALGFLAGLLFLVSRRKPV